MIVTLAWKNIWFKPLNTLLSIILLSASVAIISVLILLQEQFESKFSNNIENVSLVLGAKGSPLQLILSSVYQVDAPTGNINYSEAQQWMKHPFVEQAIPLAFGDNYKGFRIVGTTPEYLAFNGSRIQQGNAFSKNFEVVVGSDIAHKLNLKIGDSFYGAHGDAAEGDVHKEYAYVVTGIANETGKVVDNLILCTVPSVWAMHGGHDHEQGDHHEHGDHNAHHEHAHHADEGNEHNDHAEHNDDVTHEPEEHEHAEYGHSEDTGDHATEILQHDEEREITAVLIKLKNKMGFVTWPRLIAQNTKMQAASPAIEVNRLFSLFGIGLQALQYLAYGIMLISGISIFIALYSTLKERKYEFALLRISGAGRPQLLVLVLLESMFLCLTGFLIGTIVGRLAVSVISSGTDQEYKITFNPWEVIWEKEGLLLLLTSAVGLLAALLPALKAYRLNISKTLANA